MVDVLLQWIVLCDGQVRTSCEEQEITSFSQLLLVCWADSVEGDDGGDDGDDEEQKVITSFCQLLFVWLLVQQADFGTKDPDKSLAMNAEPIDGVRTSPDSPTKRSIEMLYQKECIYLGFCPLPFKR